MWKILSFVFIKSSEIQRLIDIGAKIIVIAVGSFIIRESYIEKAKAACASLDDTDQQTAGRGIGFKVNKNNEQ